MKRKMDSVLMLMFLLSFASVTTEEQEEITERIPIPEVPHALVDEMPETAENDAEIFWEVTKTPNRDIPPDVVDGNHPDNYEITTHDHVDRAVGHVLPTKRVKKILPPFEGGKQRNARHIESSPPDVTGKGTKPRDVPSASEYAENATDALTDAPTPPEDEIEGIRLLPNEREDGKVRGEGEEGEEEGGEDATVQKSIWDLLKEREQFNMDSTHLDGSANETEATTRLPAEKSKSLYEHFDSDSAEMEIETENFNREPNIQKHELPISYAMPWLQVKDEESSGEGGGEDIPQDVSKLLKLTQNAKTMNGVTVSVINGGSGEFGRRPSKWYLLLLTGNSTIVKLRRKDFTKYLKLNLAARLSVEYDDVKVNRVILAPPKVLVNISVFAPSDDVAEESQLDLKVGEKGEAPLYKLAETNATLLELSGEEYHVIRFLSFETQKPEAEAQRDVPNTVPVASRQNDVEFIIYTFLGSACACAALLTFFVTLSRFYKKVSDFSWFKPKPTAWRSDEAGENDKDEFDGVSPAVIYSGGFPQIRGSWMAGVDRREAPPRRQQRPAFDSGGSAPRPSKLQIYNCDADSLVIPIPVGGEAAGRGAGGRSDTRPLDVRILGEKTGQDNPIFSN